MIDRPMLVHPRPADPLTDDDIDFGLSPEDACSDRFPSSWQLLDDVEMMALPNPQWLIEDIFQVRTVGVIYSPSGVGKTTLLAGKNVALATGHDWFGHRVPNRGATVYVATEDPAGYKSRVKAAKLAVGLRMDVPVGVFCFPEPLDLRDASSIALFERFIRQSRHKFADLPLVGIDIDTYAAATPGANENSSEDMTTAMVHAQRWRERLGVTVTIAHHTNAGGSRERGHTAMRGAADFMISMTPVDDQIHVECSKQRNAAPFEKMELKLVPGIDGDGRVLRLASDILPSSTLTPVQQKVLGILRETFDVGTGATKTEWQRSCADVPERSFHRACKMLLEGGYIKAFGSHFRYTGQDANR